MLKQMCRSINCIYILNENNQLHALQFQYEHEYACVQVAEQFVDISARVAGALLLGIVALLVPPQLAVKDASYMSQHTVSYHARWCNPKRGDRRAALRRDPGAEPPGGGTPDVPAAAQLSDPLRNVRPRARPRTRPHVRSTRHASPLRRRPRGPRPRAMQRPRQPRSPRRPPSTSRRRWSAPPIRSLQTCDPPRVPQLMDPFRKDHPKPWKGFGLLAPPAPAPAGQHYTRMPHAPT